MYRTITTILTCSRIDSPRAIARRTRCAVAVAEYPSSATRRLLFMPPQTDRILAEPYHHPYWPLNLGPPAQAPFGVQERGLYCRRSAAQLL